MSIELSTFKQFLAKKTQNVSAPAKASFWFTISSLLQKGIQFFIVPIYTRIMSAEEFGSYSVFFSWYQIIIIFTSLNLFNYVFNNGMIKYENKRNNFIASLFGISTTLTSVWLAIYLIFNKFFNYYLDIKFPLMLCMFFELFLEPAYNYWSAELRFDYKYKKVVISSLAIAVITPLISIGLMYIMPNKGDAAIIGKVLSALVIYFPIFIFILKRNRDYFNKEYWSFSLKFNIPLIPHFLSMILMSQIDRIMIQKKLGYGDVAYYSLACNVSNALLIINTAILASFNPYFYKNLKSKNTKGIANYANSIVMIVAVVNMVVMTLAPEIIRFMGSRDYSSAMYCIPLVCASNYFVLLYNLYACVEYYFEQTKWMPLATGLGAAVDIILNYILLSKYGYIIAAWTTLISYIVMSVLHFFLMQYYLKKKTSAESVYNNLFLILVGSVLVLFSIFVNKIFDYLFIRLVIVLGICFLGGFIYKNKVQKHSDKNEIHVK